MTMIGSNGTFLHSKLASLALGHEGNFLSFFLWEQQSCWQAVSDFGTIAKRGKKSALSPSKGVTSAGHEDFKGNWTGIRQRAKLARQLSKPIKGGQNSSFSRDLRQFKSPNKTGERSEKPLNLAVWKRESDEELASWKNDCCGTLTAQQTSFRWCKDRAFQLGFLYSSGGPFCCCCCCCCFLLFHRVLTTGGVDVLHRGTFAIRVRPRRPTAPFFWNQQFMHIHEVTRTKLHEHRPHIGGHSTAGRALEADRGVHNGLRASARMQDLRSKASFL